MQLSQNWTKRKKLVFYLKKIVQLSAEIHTSICLDFGQIQISIVSDLLKSFVKYFDIFFFQSILNDHPFHVDSLLQLSDICKMGEDLQVIF